MDYLGSDNLAGTYQHASSSDQEQATLTRTGPSMVIATAHWRKTLVADEVKISDRLGQIPRRLTWPSGETFVTNDNDAVDALFVALGRSNKKAWINRLESNLPIALGSLVVVVAVYLFALLWGVPKGAAYLAHQIPASVGERAAERSLALMDKSYFKPSRMAHSQQESLREQLLAFDPYAPRIEFRYGKSIGANAMAFPGSYIVLTDELIKLADGVDEVLAVYLHEVGHGKARHAETMILQDSAWLVVLALATGDLGGVSELIFALPVTLGQMAFSRELELDADAYAIEALKREGKSPELLASMLLKLESAALEAADGDLDEGPERAPRDIETSAEPATDEAEHDENLFDYFSTHPATAERVQRIREAVNNG